MQVFSIDGRLCEAADAKVPVMDHGFLYGDGVFEGLRFYNRRILMLTAHLERLEASARALALPVPMSRAQMSASLAEVVAASGQDDGYIRLIVTRGPGPLGIDPSRCSAGQVIIIADQLAMVSDEVRRQGARLIIASTRRLTGDQLDPRIKSLNYLNQIMARLEANNAGADEAIVLNPAGYVAEGTADNVFTVSRGRLLTPPVTDGALDGITRRLILEIAAEQGMEVSERSLTTFDLFTADECFLSGTGAELIPVREIAGRKLPSSPGPVYRQIEAGFRSALLSDRLFS